MVVTTVLSIAISWVLYVDSWGGRRALAVRQVIQATTLVPFVLPTVVVGLAFTLSVKPEGPLGFLGWEATPAAIIAAMVFFNMAVVVRSLGPQWATLHREPELAAASLGAGPTKVFLTVTWPRLWPTVRSAAAVVFLYCATSFGIVLILGGLKYRTVETEIYYRATQFLDLPAAAGLTVVQIIMVVALTVASSGDTITSGVPNRSATPRTSPFVRAVLYAAASVGAVLIIVPMTTLIWQSFRTPNGTGLDNYAALIGVPGVSQQNPAVAEFNMPVALWNSLAIATQTTLITVVMMLAVATVINRVHSRARRLLIQGYFLMPLGVSAVVVGLGFLITLNRPPLDIRSSSLLIPIAHSMVATPVALRIVQPAVDAVNPAQRLAAATLGANPFRVWWTIDVPAMWRALVVAAGFAFVISLGEFGASSFLATAERPTLPTAIYRLMGRPGPDSFGAALAGSVILAALTTTLIMVIDVLQRQIRIKHA